MCNHMWVYIYAIKVMYIRMIVFLYVTEIQLDS